MRNRTYRGPNAESNGLRDPAARLRSNYGYHRRSRSRVKGRRNNGRQLSRIHERCREQCSAIPLDLRLLHEIASDDRQNKRIRLVRRDTGRTDAIQCRRRIIHILAAGWQNDGR